MLEQAIITVQGFSCYAGLPSQAAFTTQLLRGFTLHKKRPQAKASSSTSARS